MDNMVDFHFVLLVLRGGYIISDLKIYGKIFHLVLLSHI